MSPGLAGFLSLTHGAALAAVLMLPSPWTLRVILVVLVVAGLAYGVQAHLLRRLPWAVREAVWEPDGRWTLVLASGQEVEARLSPATFVWSRLVVLIFRRGRWRSGSLVLTSDSLDPDLLRRLRVRLRVAGHAATGLSDSKV